MARFSSKEKARAMLRDAIISLCRESIPHKEEIAVDGLLGITIDQKDVFLVTIHEMLGGGHVKKKRHSEATMGLTVKSVEGNSSMFYSDGEEKSILSRKRKFKSSSMSATKRLQLANGSTKGTSVITKNPEPETVNIMGENVEIKQEKPDSEDENNSDPGDWQLCVDQTSNDDVLANEVLEMSGEHLTNFSSLPGTPYGRRSTQLRFHEFSQECGTHRPHLIPPTARRSHPQKRCRVCYRQGLRKESRYCCPVCPGYPGLCVVPCFEMYHADKSYQSASNLGFNLQEVDANFDITKALGLSTKSHMVVKQDSLGRRTLVSTGEHEAVIENEYVGPDEVEQFYANLQMADEDYDDFDRSMSDNLESDKERESDAEQEQELQGKEPEQIELSEEMHQQIKQVTGELNEEVNEESKEDTNEDSSTEAIGEGSCPSEESPEDEPSKESPPEDEDSQPEEMHMETIEIIPYGKKESENLISESLRSENIIGGFGKETSVDVSRPSIKTNIATATVPNAKIMVAQHSESNDMPTISTSSAGIVTKSLSPQTITRVLPAYQLPSKVTTSSQQQTKVISSPQPQTKVLAPPQIQTKVIASPQAQAKVISSSQLSTKLISSPKLQFKDITSPQIHTKLIPVSQIPGQRTTIKLSPSSVTGTKVDGTRILTTGAKAGTSNVITLPAGALAGGKTTAVRIPTAGGATKTYMITKTATGEIKKTPIILKTVPAGKLQQASSGMTTRTITRSVASSLVGGKSIVKTIVPTQYGIVPKEEPQSPPVPQEEDGDEEEGNPTIDLVPTPTSLSTQVLKILVDKTQSDHPV